MALEVHPRAKTWQFWALITALFLSVGTIVKISDMGKIGDPRRPHPAPTASATATTAPTPTGSAGTHTPVCQSPLQAQCWESEDDGTMPTMWRETARAMMLQQSMIDELSRTDPGRDWSQCWIYLHRTSDAYTVECPGGYVTEVRP